MRHGDPDDDLPYTPYREWTPDTDDDDSDQDWDDDRDDRTPMRECSQCGAAVYEDSPACPICGTYLPADTSAWSGRPVWWILLGLLGMLMVVLTSFLVA